MTIIAKRNVQLKGHIYSKGEAAEYNGVIDSRIADLFTDKDGKPLSMTPPDGENKEETPPDGEKKEGEDKEGISLERIQNLVKTLGRKGIEQKLDELRVSYRPRTSDSQLALLLLQQQGEI